MTVKKYINRLLWFPLFFILIYLLVSSVIVWGSIYNGEQNLFMLVGFPAGALLLLYFETPKIVRGIKLYNEIEDTPIIGTKRIEKLIEPWFDRRGLKVTTYIQLEGSHYYFDENEDSRVIFDLVVGDLIRISYYPNSRVILKLEKMDET